MTIDRDHLRMRLLDILGALNLREIWEVDHRLDRWLDWLMEADRPSEAGGALDRRALELVLEETRWSRSNRWATPLLAERILALVRPNERVAAALALHKIGAHGFCQECTRIWPCATARALGADTPSTSVVDGG